MINLQSKFNCIHIAVTKIATNYCEFLILFLFQIKVKGSTLRKKRREGKAKDVESLLAIIHHVKISQIQHDISTIRQITVYFASLSFITEYFITKLIYDNITYQKRVKFYYTLLHSR